MELAGLEPATVTSGTSRVRAHLLLVTAAT
jgi:hypothetical protein